MRVLVACEFSGIVRDAFRSRGHDAWSCDVLPCEGAQTWHILGDVRRVLEGRIPFGMIGESAYRGVPIFREWDLMIAHPPCTYLANSGVRWLYKSGTIRNEARWDAMKEAVKFFGTLWSAPTPRICIENPIMHKHARSAFGFDCTQLIQPWQFGHGEIKATCLWLKNLPKLTPTQMVEGRHARVHREPPSPERWKNRSRTYQGIADAMAEQWGAL